MSTKSKKIETKVKTKGEKESNEKIQTECYKYMCELARIIYDNEREREYSVIDQSGRMQSAFSFVIAALFMAVPVILEYRGCLSLEFLFVAFSSIVGTLLFSLFAATMAQNRKKRKDFPPVSTIEKRIIGSYKEFDSSAKRDKYLVGEYKDVQESLSKINDKRMLWIRISTYSFYIALGLCALCFFVAICKII